MPANRLFIKSATWMVALISTMIAMVVLAIGASAPVFAAAPAPAWTVESASAPSSFKPDDETGDDTFVLEAVNSGDAAAKGSAVTLTDTLPTGVEAKSVASEDLGNERELTCPPTPKVVVCSYEGSEVAPGDVLRVVVTVNVTAAAVEPDAVNSVVVSGGGAGPASTSAETPISGTLAPFGVSSLLLAPSSTQAAGHPDLTTSFTLAQTKQAGEDEPSEPVRDVELDLPVGVVGSATAVPRCTANGVENGTCPSDTAVGVAYASLSFNPGGFPQPYSGLVYNIAPYQGEPAAFMFTAASYPVRLDTSVRLVNHQYRLHVSVHDVTEVEPALSSTVTLWGIPANFNNAASGPDHVLYYEGLHYGSAGGGVTTPFLTNSDACSTPSLTATIGVGSWLAPESTILNEEGFAHRPAPYPTPTGCGLLSFEPSISVRPDTLQAGQPAGYTVDLKVPQNESPTGLATPDLKNASVTFPSGTVVSPSAADGLGACSPAQIDMESEGPASCPDNSKIGTVDVTTPLLEAPLTGSVYQAQQNNNPFNSLLAIYVVAEGSGVRVKLAGKVTPNLETGQLTTTFEENPQLPFSDLRLTFTGGPRAPLANPATCGEALTTSDLTPWSTPATPDASPTSSFEVKGCSPPRFAPSFVAETTNNQAGGYSPFSVTISRADADQNLGEIQVRTPPGLLGMISHVPLCGEAQANADACPESSEIGTTTTSAGPGPTPYYFPGRAYLTGPYRGAPFGLLFVTPAVAGPFDLGKVNVRAQIRIDPSTAQITVVSDQLPHILNGIPLQLKTIDVNVSRREFMFNPTSCEALAVTGAVRSLQGASANVSTRFQAANCASLPFKPSFTVSTQAKYSKLNGASLTVKVASSPGQANIAKVDLQLPLALPSRLSTLNKACVEAQFNANPAGCPAGSIIGYAKAVTPVLNVPLIGPAILVSHGGAAFPDVEFILQGQGVTIVLDGKTEIKKGITYSHFDTVPDAPISSFETVLPEGPHSILGAYLAKGTLCTNKLLMPTTITGQNGAVIKQTTKIAVTGCPKVKKASRARKAKRARRARHR